MKVLITVVLGFLLAGCAAGRGNGTGSATTQEETTALITKEGTTVLEAGGNPSRPPDSTLSYGGREVKGKLGSYCWTSGNSGGCADVFDILIPPKQQTLTVPPDSEMMFHYGGQSPPKTVEAVAYPLNKLHKKRQDVHPPHHSLEAPGSGIERAIPAELPSGEYVVDVFITARQGDATYYFRVIVE